MYIIQNSASVLDSTQFQYENPMTGNKIGFSFVASVGSDSTFLFSTTNPDAFFTFNVVADLEVTYTTSFVVSKRSATEVSKLQVSRSVVLDISNYHAAMNDANDAGLLSYSLAAPVAIGVAATLANL